jgi:hypothetical protein
MKKTLLKIAVATAVALPLGAQATLHVFTANLNAAQEVQTPAVDSPALGSFHAIYDDVTNVFTYMSLVGQGLRPEVSPGVPSNISGLHIHGIGAGGPAGSNSGIALGLDHTTVVRTGNAFFFAATGQGGLPGVDDQTTFNETEEGHLLAGRSYINLHTDLYSSGEIRGQINAIPEPSTYALMLAGLGLVGLGAARRRKLF